MDKATIARNIAEVQRSVGNLHATISNFLSSQRLEINGHQVTAADAEQYLADQVLHIQQQLGEAALELKK